MPRASSNMGKMFIHLTEYDVCHIFESVKSYKCLYLIVLNTFKISKILDFCKIINPEISIHRDHLIETSFSV